MLWLVHARSTCGTHGDIVFPSAFRNGLQVEVDGVLSAVRCGNVRVRTDDGLPLGWFAALPPSSQYRMSARRPALRRQRRNGWRGTAPRRHFRVEQRRRHRPEQIADEVKGYEQTGGG